MNNINWFWLGSDVIALKTVDIHFERSKHFILKDVLLCLRNKRQDLVNPISDYDNQVYL